HPVRALAREPVAVRGALAAGRARDADRQPRRRAHEERQRPLVAATGADPGRTTGGDHLMTLDCPLEGLEPAAFGASGLRHHHLECRAEGEAATLPMTWAQQHMLMLFQALEPETQSLNLQVRLALRDGLTLDQVLEALRDLVVGHEALRTRYVPPPEGPAQRILSDVGLTVAVLDCGEQVPDKTL